MIITLLNWVYIFITLYIIGHFAYKKLAHFTAGDSNCYVNISNALLMGFAVTTALSGYYSLFAGVGIIANIIMLILCVVFAIADLNDYKKMCSLHNIKSFIVSNIAVVIIGILLIAVCLYFTAYGHFDYDSGLYHAQSIHWIEKYGVLPGLAYMQTRLGFNSSFFCISALYSFHDFGQSLHSLNGFMMAVILIKGSVGIISSFTAGADNNISYENSLTVPKSIKIISFLRKILTFDNFMNLVPFLYFAMVCYELTSPTTDCASNCLIIWIILTWSAEMCGKSAFSTNSVNSDNKNSKLFTYAFLSVMAVFLVSIKLSVGVIALLVIHPAVKLIKEKKFKDIIIYMVTGIVLVAPYFIRNVIITGWIIYPFPAIDIFNFDWKIPLSGVQYESNEVIVWARYTKDVALIDQKMSEWLPIWWQEQGQINRHITTSAFIGCLLSAILIIKGTIVKKIRHESGEKLFFMAIMFISFTFWMVSAPSNRFGYAYIITVSLMGIGLMFELLFTFSLSKEFNKYIHIMSASVAIIICIFALLPMAKGMRMQLSDDFHSAVNSLNSQYIISQRDYEPGDTSSKEWNGFTIYYPTVEGSQIWYDAFPAILYEGNLDGIEMRGNSIHDGFRLK